VLVLTLAVSCTHAITSFTADYIIVGGGTAGCTLAARLCATLPGAQIALLERGALRTVQQDLLVSALRNTFAAWDTPTLVEKWQSEPNAGLQGRRVDVLSGATLGGSSTINGADWTRPTADVPAGWGVRGLTAIAADRLFLEAAVQIGAAQPPEDLRHTYVNEWLQAAADDGVRRANAAFPIGRPADMVWVNRLTADAHGRRRDACTAYLQPVLQAGGKCAHNLNLVQDALVTQLQLQGDRAVTVEYMRSGEASLGARSIVRARREVISCAGPYGSPKLLQLSGIGPAALLQERGVPLEKDLPVGQNAQARPFSFVTYSYSGRPLARENNRSAVTSTAAIEQFLQGRGGVLGVGIAQANGVLGDADTLISSATAHPPPSDNEPRIAGGCLINPASRGVVAISSADPLASVNVSTNLLGDDAGEDAGYALACVQRQRAIMERMPPDFGLHKEYPEENDFTEDTMRSTTENGNHFVGSCNVGAVLDADLKVEGYRNLRVVDASAIPDIPLYAGAMSSVYLLAEHAAEMLVADAPSKLRRSRSPATRHAPAAAPPTAAPLRRAARNTDPAQAELQAQVQVGFSDNGSSSRGLRAGRGEQCGGRGYAGPIAASAPWFASR
jgi:choline dehydrogenase